MECKPLDEKWKVHFEVKNILQRKINSKLGGHLKKVYFVSKINQKARNLAAALVP